MPFSYAHMLHLILLLFTLVAVPLVFAEGLDGWLMVPTSGIVALIFYGINELASEIENPFGWQENDHNLSRFCKMCRTETRMLEEWYRAQGAEAAGAQGAEACDKLDGLIRGAEKVSGPTASDAKSK